MDKKLIKIGIANALLTALYITLIALLMTNTEHAFTNVSGVFIGIAMLLMFVVSAAITSALVLGKPVMLYWDGKKKEALKVFALTVGTLAVILVLVFLGLFLNK